MGSEFEPAVRTEDTPLARIVEIDLPGFRREDLKVQVNNKGSLIISGERGAKEMEGGRSEKMQKGGYKFRKVISVPKDLNFDGITAKFTDEKLRVSLPLLHVSDQQNQADTVPGSEKTDQLQSKVERSSPAGQQAGSIKEQPAPARPVQDERSPRHPEPSRLDDNEKKPAVAAEELNELPENKNAEAPKQAAESIGEPPISCHAQADVSESIQSKSKQDDETLPQEYGGQKTGKAPECKHPTAQEKKKDDAKPAQNLGRHVRNRVDGVISTGKRFIRQQQEREKRIQFPASCSSTVSKRDVLIASSLLVLSVGLYITIKSKRGHHI